MKRVSIISFLGVLICHLSFGQNDDTTTLRKLNRSFLDAIVNRDSASLSNILADDFILINPGGEKRNKAQNLSLAVASNQRVVSVDVDKLETRLLSADVGLVTAWTTNKVSLEGKIMTFPICYQDVYMKRKNKWVAVAAHVSSLDCK
jgi:ketosteroid isomerase-like protein